MLKKENLKINKFFIVFFVVMAILSGIVVYSGNKIFNALLLSRELQTSGDLDNIRLDEDKFNRAYRLVFEKKTEKLQIK